MGKPVLILVAGGTASGKTTVVDKLLDIFGKKDISVIYMDNYYKERNDLSLEERKKINYDHPNSFDMEQLSNDLRRLMNGETIYTPLYDFANHNRNSEITIKVDPTKVIILEGILSMYDTSIRNLSDIKIFVESEADIRFIRRLKRDIATRGREMNDVIMQYLLTVKPMYDEYVAPTKRFADIIIPNDTKHDVALEIIAAKIKDLIK